VSRLESRLLFHHASRYTDAYPFGRPCSRMVRIWQSQCLAANLLLPQYALVPLRRRSVAELGGEIQPQNHRARPARNGPLLTRPTTNAALLTCRPPRARLPSRQPAVPRPESQWRRAVRIRLPVWYTASTMSWRANRFGHLPTEVRDQGRELDAPSDHVFSYRAPSFLGWLMNWQLSNAARDPDHNVLKTMF